LSDKDYTQLFLGTSASAAIVSGVSAAVIASDATLSAEGVKQLIRNTADKIGTIPYTADRNDFHGYGRVNMNRALSVANGLSDPGNVQGICTPQAFDFSNTNDLLRFQTLPQSLSFCPARGPRVPDDSACYTFKSLNGKVGVFCL